MHLQQLCFCSLHLKTVFLAVLYSLRSLSCCTGQQEWQTCPPAEAGADIKPYHELQDLTGLPSLQHLLLQGNFLCTLQDISLTMLASTLSVCIACYDCLWQQVCADYSRIMNDVCGATLLHNTNHGVSSNSDCRHQVSVVLTQLHSKLCLEVQHPSVKCRQSCHGC